VTTPTFCWESILKHSPQDTFAWHTRPRAFERFNPPWRPVRIVQAPQALTDGNTVHLKVPFIGNFGISWKLIHKDYQEGAQFCDEQVRGPFQSWRHVHRFISEGGSSCRMRDEIFFKPPYGIGLLTPLIKKELARLFQYRHMVLKDDLALHARWKDLPRKTVLIGGSSGFIGSALVAFLSTAGHNVLRLVRHEPRNEHERFWDPLQGRIAPSVFDGVDVVIHLGGESIIGQRWTPEYKKRIVESRVVSSQLLCGTIARLSRKPEVVIMASAVGIYGDTKDIPADESSPAGTGFLAETGIAWENSARHSLNGVTRLVHLRIGTVLNPAGGALKKMLPPFKLGVGGVLGSGKQYMSWIALQDLLGIFEHAIYTPSVQGPVNAVSPHPVTNLEFTKTLGHLLHRPTILATPASVLRIVFGEVADEALLASSRVAPTALMESGYSYVLPNLHEALGFECGIFS
jgi:uncharacterized protein (TIGR01777 family)